ncbi:MAG TPA: hypothetical protein VMT43_06600 [Acidimicrobiales bacterium]|nr:hypothetical protein [Acidimicrobiales bacterium]
MPRARKPDTADDTADEAVEDQAVEAAPTSSEVPAGHVVSPPEPDLVAEPDDTEPEPVPVDRTGGLEKGDFVGVGAELVDLGDGELYKVDPDTGRVTGRARG